MQDITPTPTFSSDPDSRMYLSPSAIGWDYAEKLRVGVMKWAGLDVESHPVEVGTQEAYNAYRDAMASGHQHHLDTGTKCLVDLIPELDRWYGWRVEVISSDGSKRRFNVGRSTGWIPCNLEIHNARSMSGFSATILPGETIVPIRKVSR